MVEVTGGVSAGFLDIYNSMLLLFPTWAQNFINLFLLVLLVVAYSVFIWKLYRFVAKKNLLDLNLNQYNKSEHPTFSKIVASGFYLLEYVVILPFLIFFWFAFFTFFLILLTEGLDVPTILIVSATIIAAIRMTAYYSEDLSRDLAKMLPFTLLALAITKSGFFEFERVISHLSSIPEFFSSIFIYLAFIASLEIILRLFDFIFIALGVADTGEEEKVEVLKK
jgi:hypothetical protein